MFVLWAKPLSDLAEYELNVTLHKHDCIYSQKGTVNYSETCSKCKKFSLEWEGFHEIWKIYRGDIEKRISGNFAAESILKFTVFSKLKTERHFNPEVQSVTGPESGHL